MKLIKKFLEFALGQGIVVIISFIASPIITRIISTDNMGRFSMFNTFASLFTLVVLMGLDQAYIRYYYDESEADRGMLLKVCIKLPLLISVGLSVILLLFYKKISVFIIGRESFIMAVLIAVQLFISIVARFALLEVRMHQKAKFYSFLNVVIKASYIITVGFLFTVFKDHYYTLIIPTIISNAVMVVVAVTVERETWLSKGKKINTSKEELIRYGIPFIFSMIVTWLFQSIDKMSIRSFCGYEQVGLYSGAMTIVNILNSIQGAFNIFWTPVALERYSKYPGDTEFFSKINKSISLIMLLSAIGVITFKDIIIYFLGQDYRASVFILPYLVFMPVMNCISETTVIGINFKKKTRNHIYIAVITAMFNLAGNTILVPYLGAKGAAISTGVSYMVFFLVRTLISKQYYKVNYSLGRLMLCTLSCYVLAAYSSFNKFDYIIAAMAVFSVIIVLLSYYDIVKKVLGLMYKKIRSYI